MNFRFLIDKGILFLLCCWTLFESQLDGAAVITALLCLFLSSLISCTSKRTADGLTILFFLGCFLFPGLFYFLPLLTYDLQRCPAWQIRVSWITILLLPLMKNDLPALGSCFLLSCAALLLSLRSRDAEEARKTFYRTRDEMREASLNLERRNRELMEKQDYEIQVATLRERNRIAREIHDNVGHLLTRSLFQVKALRITVQDQPRTEAQLAAVNDTLTEAMNRIRESVHDLHEESLNLKLQLLSLTSQFSFCPVTLRYDMGNPPKEIKYCFLAVVREALNNIARHSSATRASVSLIEHPGLYQLTVTDNGCSREMSASPGIGLASMQERVAALNGIFRLQTEQGFKIFISIPKERNFI